MMQSFYYMISRPIFCWFWRQWHTTMLLYNKNIKNKMITFISPTNTDGVAVTYHVKACVRGRKQRPLELSLWANSTRQRWGWQTRRHKVDRVYPLLTLLSVRRLKQVLRPVRRLQTYHVLLFRIVCCLGSEAVVNAYGVVRSQGVWLLQCLFVLVQVKNHVAQHHVEHLPASLPHRSWESIPQLISSCFDNNNHVFIYNW